MWLWLVPLSVQHPGDDDEVGDGGEGRFRAVEAVLTRARPVLLDKADVKEMILEEVVKVEEVKEEVKVKVKEKEPGRRSLRVGAEGDDVRAMQEALQKLGFYSGEEDMEYSSFYSGTERAVKTWQATLGTREDGIMTEELLEMLFSEKKTSDVNVKEGVNGAAIASAAQVAAEIEKTVVKESNASNSGVEVSKYIVFLLGENRWEEPSRLVQNNNKQEIKNSRPTSGIKCLSCRGEGCLCALNVMVLGSQISSHSFWSGLMKEPNAHIVKALVTQSVISERLGAVEAIISRVRPVLIQKAEVKEMILGEVVKVEEVKEVVKVREREPARSLRVGIEGDYVRAMQV
ncbi:hypothetical protein LUZ61_010105 [Rhynchospora tenuis]|uniref:Peptidoglycan binding-like domain-containing protein n=1 Tax=Rhynchospora tenuis TaxID=198213 RepID=A0AAD5ZYL9_9POAL|nr:hypothetical protein LUZ61_010105 [Rhynchospora tenuis]